MPAIPPPTTITVLFSTPNSCSTAPLIRSRGRKGCPSTRFLSTGKRGGLRHQFRSMKLALLCTAEAKLFEQPSVLCAVVDFLSHAGTYHCCGIAVRRAKTADGNVGEIIGKVKTGHAGRTRHLVHRIKRQVKYLSGSGGQDHVLLDVELSHRQPERGRRPSGRLHSPHRRWGHCNGPGNSTLADAGPPPKKPKTPAIITARKVRCPVRDSFISDLLLGPDGFH